MKNIIIFSVLILIFFGCDAEKYVPNFPEPEQSGYGKFAIGSSPMGTTTAIFKDGKFIKSVGSLSQPDSLPTGVYYYTSTMEGFETTSGWFEIKPNQFTSVGVNLVREDPGKDTAFVVVPRDSIIIIHDTTWITHDSVVVINRDSLIIIKDTVYIQRDPIIIHETDTTQTYIVGEWLNANYVYSLRNVVSFNSVIDGQIELSVITNNNSFDEQDREIITAEINEKPAINAIGDLYDHVWSKDPVPQQEQYIKSSLGIFDISQGKNSINLFSLKYFNENEPRHSVGVISLMIKYIN